MDVQDSQTMVLHIHWSNPEQERQKEEEKVLSHF